MILWRRLPFRSSNLEDIKAHNDKFNGKIKTYVEGIGIKGETLEERIEYIKLRIEERNRRIKIYSKRSQRKLLSFHRNHMMKALDLQREQKLRLEMILGRLLRIRAHETQTTIPKKYKFRGKLEVEV